MTSAMPSKIPVGDRGHRRAGFTLIELLVVLSLLGILAGMIAPRFRGTVRAIEAEEAARIVTAHLQELRARAARHGQSIEVEFDPAVSDGFLVRTFAAPSRPAWDFTPIDAAEKRTGSRESTFRIPFDGAITADPPLVVIHADGRSSESMLTLRAADGRVTVLELGRRGMITSLAAESLR